MKGILADINVQGHLLRFVAIWQSEYWREIWDGMNLTLHTLAEMGLDHDSPDTLVWQTCQDSQLVLLTANRNDDGPSSLAAAIRADRSSTSLPVITLADATRAAADPAYVRRAAERMLDYLDMIDKVRGAGRLFIP